MAQQDKGLKSFNIFFFALIGISFAVLLLIGFIHEGFADGPKKHISIILSKGCIAGNSTCPNYMDLAKQFDNTNRDLSGDFYKDKNGIWKRDKPIMRGSYEFYNNDRTPITIFVDPDDYTREKTKIIYIELQLPIYKSGYPVQNATYITNHNRKIIKCEEATVGWKDGGYDLFLDTLNYFISDCTATLKFSDEKKTYKPMIIKDKCGAQCKYQQWLDEAIKKSKSKFIIDPKRELKDSKQCRYVKGQQVC